MIRTSLVGGVMAALVAATPMSGTTAQEPDTIPADERVIELEPILVRVLRSPVGSGSPYSVAVAAGGGLTRANAGAHLEEAIRALPGVQIQNRFNMAVGERLSIRGHGPRAQFGVRGVRVLVDGIPATLPDGQSTLDHLDLGGLARVEALRGPAASLYGNAAGGVLHLSTLGTGAGTTAGTRIRASAGSHGLLSLRGEIGNSPTPGSSYRAAYAHLEYNGYRRDPVAADGGVYSGGRRSVVNASWRTPLAGGSFSAMVNGVDLSARNPGSLSEGLLEDGDRQAYRFNVVSKTGKDVLQGQVGASWEGPLAFTDTELALWGILREVDNPIPGRVIDLGRGAGGFRSLSRTEFETGEGTLALGVGVEYQLQSDDRKNYGNDGGERTDLRLDQRERVAGSSAFAQVRFDLRENGFSAVAGLRADRFDFSADDRHLADGIDDSGSRVMSAVSPSFGLVARRGAFEVFGSVARSFETPTTTELANRADGAGGLNNELGAQRGLALEGGVRMEHAAGAFETVLFRSRLNDELVPFEVPSEPGRTFYHNAGESVHTGAELSLLVALGEIGRLRMAYTRVNARFESYTPEGSDYSGNRVPGLAPDRLDTVLSIGTGSFFGDVRALGQSAVPVDDAGESESPAFFLADLRFGLDGADLGSTTISPWVAVTNLFDRTYNSSVVVNAFGGRYFEPGPGRGYTLGIEMALDR